MKSDREVQQLWTMLGHSLRGLCGLKSGRDTGDGGDIRHSLRGLCGLKLLKNIAESTNKVSQPARAVWIEICIALFPTGEE